MLALPDKIDALTVLVIEDNPDDAEILENHLAQISHKKMELVFQESLKLGLSRLAQGGIDIVFLDLSLPDSNGLESLIKIRNLAPLMPIIVLTGRDDYALSLQSLKMGAQDYLLKSELGASGLERSIDYARVRPHVSKVSEVLESLVHSSVDAIIGCSLDGKILSWNSGAELMFGYPPAEASVQSIDFFLPEGRVGKILVSLAQAERDFCIDSFESVGVRKDGSTLSVSCSISPLRDSEGLSIGAVIVMRDISARLSVEKDLRQSNQRLQLAVLSAKVGIWSWDTQAGEIIWDDRMYAFFGRAKGNFPQKNNKSRGITLGSLMEAVHPEDRGKFSEALAKVLEQNSNYECAYRIIWPDSSVHFLEASGVLCFDTDGKPSIMIGICIDVTERQTMEQNVREINRLHERIASAIVQNAPVGIVTLNSDLTITDVNSAFSTMACMEIKELLLKPLSIALPIEVFRRAQESVKNGSSFQISRYKINLPGRSSERLRYWDLSFWPVLSGQGTTAVAILQVTDCTGAVMLEEQRDDFVAAVAHDIKNPLIGAARLLDHLCSQPEVKPGHSHHEILTMLRDSNDGLLGLVQNLVDVHQNEVLGYPIVCTEVNLHNTMDSCIKQIKYFCDSRKVTIHLRESPAPIVISADFTGLSRVFMNLLHNAVKFSQSGSYVHVVISRINPTTVEIAVSDTGDGISIADQEKLFERYGQAEGGRRKANSSGLGLYLSRQIVQGHCGQIGCKSEVGVGSTFFVRLPINQPSQNTQNGETNANGDAFAKTA